MSNRSDALTTETLLMTNEVAGMFGVKSYVITRAVPRWERQGKVSIVRTPGGYLRYRAADIEAMIANGDHGLSVKAGD